MYQKYHTQALVLAGRQRGEADKVLALYTSDFGLVYARASGIRAENSRMRYALQNYSRTSVSLVRGKRGWRLAGASNSVGVAFDSAEAEGVKAFARIAHLIMRLVRGEEPHAYLFRALAEAQRLLVAEGSAAWPTIEIVCVARVLYALGYVSAETLETTLFAHTGYGDPQLAEADLLRDRLLLSINRAIEETQL